jgi:plastocyanin
MRPSARLLFPLTGLALVSGLACNSMTSNSGGGGGGGNTHATDVVIVLNAQNMGYHAFTPDTFTVSLAAGGLVKWGNHDLGTAYGDPGVTHHLVSDDGTTFVTPNIGPSSSYTFTFMAEGTFAYHCTIHPTMHGAITVAP